MHGRKGTKLLRANTSLASVRPEIASILDFTQFRGDWRGEELS